MNKFLLLLTAVAFLLTGELAAQKVKNKRIDVAYTRLPSKPLDPSFTTYSSVVYGSEAGLERLGYDRERVAKNSFSLGGFKRVGQGGHFRISVNAGYPYTTSAKTESYKETVGKDENKKTVTRYKMVVIYTVPMRYKVEDYQGNVLTSGSFGKEQTFEWGKGAASYSGLRKNWSAQSKRIMADKFKKGMSSNFSSAAGNIRALYGYTPRKASPQIEMVSKKTDSAEEFEQAYETAKTAFAAMKANEKPDAVKEALKPAMDFWIAEKAKWSPDDKKERKVYSACIYNLATAYYWLDELEESEKLANEIIEVDFKIGRGKSLLREIEGTKNLMKKNNTTSRHPSFDLTNAQPPAKSAFGAFEAVDEGGAAATKLTGSMTDKDGNKIEGDFAVTAEEGEELKFGPQGNIKFNYSKDGRTVGSTLDPAQMQGFTLGERNFVVADFVPGAKGNTESKISVLELLYDGGSIQVLKYYPYDDALGNQDVEFAFQKTGEEKPTSTSSTTFLLFNKGLQKYFADCADLAEVAGTGEFKKTEDDIIRAARVYAEMCKAP